MTEVKIYLICFLLPFLHMGRSENDRDLYSQGVELVNAVEAGDTRFADLLTNFGEDIKQTYSDYKNLLHIAADAGAVPSIHWLVEKGLSVNSTDDNKWTPLHYAARSGRSHAVEALLQLGACVSCKNLRGESALMVAIKSNQPTSAAKIVEFGGELKEKWGDYEANLLHTAAANGALESIAWLVQRGFDVNETDNDRWMSLHYAASNGQLHAVDTLIKLKSCIICRDVVTFSPIFHAVRKDHLATASLLVESGADLFQKFYSYHNTLLHEASANDAVHCIPWLVKKGINVDYIDEQNSTALNVAAWWGKLNSAKILVDLGACINCKDKGGATPYHNAIKRGHQDFADFLKAHGGTD